MYVLLSEASSRSKLKMYQWRECCRTWFYCWHFCTYFKAGVGGKDSLKSKTVLMPPFTSLQCGSFLGFSAEWPYRHVYPTCLTWFAALHCTPLPLTWPLNILQGSRPACGIQHCCDGTRAAVSAWALAAWGLASKTSKESTSVSRKAA